ILCLPACLPVTARNAGEAGVWPCSGRDADVPTKKKAPPKQSQNLPATKPQKLISSKPKARSGHAARPALEWAAGKAGTDVSPARERLDNVVPASVGCAGSRYRRGLSAALLLTVFNRPSSRVRICGGQRRGRTMKRSPLLTRSRPRG